MLSSLGAAASLRGPKKSASSMPSAVSQLRNVGCVRVAAKCASTLPRGPRRATPQCMRARADWAKPTQLAYDAARGAVGALLRDAELCGRPLREGDPRRCARAEARGRRLSAERVALRCVLGDRVLGDRLAGRGIDEPRASTLAHPRKRRALRATGLDDLHARDSDAARLLERTLALRHLFRRAHAEDGVDVRELLGLVQLEVNTVDAPLVRCVGAVLYEHREPIGGLLVRLRPRDRDRKSTRLN